MDAIGCVEIATRFNSSTVPIMPGETKVKETRTAHVSKHAHNEHSRAGMLARTDMHRWERGEAGGIV